MKKVLEVTVQMPTYALSYLVNGDNSGLEDEDIRVIDEYMKQYEEMGSVIVDPLEGESYFSWRSEFGLAGDVIDTNIIVLK